MDTYGMLIMGTGALVAGACAFVGCFLVLRRMAMLGDAISHSVLLGIVLAFLFTGDRGIVSMFIGAAALGLLTAVMVQTLEGSGVSSDAAIGVTFTAFFALGVVLLTAFAGRVHLDLEHVLYGEIAYVPWDVFVIGDTVLGPRAMWTMGAMFAVNLIVIGLFYKELKLCAFDAGMAAAIGINVALFHYLLMGLVSLTTVAAFESVGAILSVAMLIVPGATAYLLTHDMRKMLALSVLFGVASSIGGYAVATWIDCSIAGAMAGVSGLYFVAAVLFSPSQGVITRLWTHRGVGAEGQGMVQ